ncbi:glycosyl hydrolase family 25 [Prevotella scopos JCM 17725]|jgi:glycosyl hydrolase, family 25|uniref:Lysozyme n=1 Tax=Prevotella scopos JCM 17725 TaxID=1236518 RepID=A0AAX2F151_9BACT|nr:GH25 family lysozyme [Prevotella scopos]ANR74214.1 glycosyl hydrolase family 25 [Prevotella scopos JCM 17725]QUB44806.1 glycosyl hydrolase family 25 [Prevotella scopos JCM 17725]SHF58678.1 lysozyme [Prevotella scopos JCM 17725]
MKSNIFQRFIYIILLSAICVIAYASKTSHKSSKSVKRQYDGIDVSHHQGNIDWKEVAKDKHIRFVYIKATQGTSVKDNNYERNIKAAHRQGLRCGSYHYLSCLTSIRSQFRNFQQAMKGHKQDLIPMIDIEREGVKCWSKKQVQDSVALFAKLIKNKYGKKPLIYSHVNFYNSHLSPRFNKHFLFLSRYSSVRPSIKGVGRHNIWQYSDRGKIRGIRGHVDLDCFMSGTSLADIRL